MRGLISLNRAAYQALGEPESIELLYNPSKRIIGIRPGDPKTPHSYPLRQQNRGGTYLIAGKAFTTHYEIDTKVARRYGVEAKVNTLLVDLKQRATEVVGARAQRNTQVTT